MSAEGKITTARIAKGNVILVQRLNSDKLDAVSRKTGDDVLVATVKSVSVEQSFGRRRTLTRYVLHTDIGETVSLAPAQTFWLASARKR